MNNKLIGIVGGLGPKAGENLHAAILNNTRAVKDSDHLRILLYTNPAIPDRTEFILGQIEQNPADEILRSMEQLIQFGAQVLCVPCNTAHCPMIWDVVEEGFTQFGDDLRLLHIIDSTVEFLVRTQPRASHAGILATNGTTSSAVYQNALLQRGIQPVLATDSNQRRVQEAIYHPDWGLKAKASPVTQQAIDALETAAVRMIADGAEALILGCTEIPLALPGSDLKGIPLINSTAVLARECIRHAAGEDKLLSLAR